MAKRKKPNGFSNLKPAVTRAARNKYALGLRRMTRRLNTVMLIELRLKSLESFKNDLSKFFKEQVWWEEEGQKLVESTAKQLDKKMKDQFYKDLSNKIGIEVNPVIKELGLTGDLNRVVDDTMDGINSLKGSIQQRVEELLKDTLISNRDITKGTLGEQIADVTNMSTQQSKNLARSMTSKVNGQMNQSRMARAGIEKYVWSSSHDIAVRPSHKAADDNTYQVGENVTVDTPGEGLVEVGHPGFDWGCRCTAIPLLS